MGARKLYC